LDNKAPESEKSIKFTEAELALIDQGIAELDRGEGVTFEQARKLARERTKAWMSVNLESA